MNTGIVSARYAEALLKYVHVTGNGQQVYDQVLFLDKCMVEIDVLRGMINNPKSVADKVKLNVLCTVIGGEKDAAPELMQLFALIIKNKRVNFLPVIIRTFITKYRHENHIFTERLTVATESKELEEILKERGKLATGGEILIDTIVDPSIIGGFILDVGDMRMDASVASQLQVIRHQYIEKNRRIV